MFKKNLAVATALTLTIGLLSGCGDTDAYEDAVSGTSSTTTEDTTAITEDVDTSSLIDTSSFEIVETDGTITDLHLLPVEDYVEMGEYTGLEVSVATLIATDAEESALYADEVYVSMAASMGIVDTEGTVETGDVVVMDYSGALDGVAFDGGTATGASLEIGSGTFIDGFEDGLIGVSVGETVDLTLTFPDDYSSTDLAGQETVFTVTVTGIVSDMSDESVAKLEGFGFTSVEEYYAFVQEYLDSANLQTYEYELENNLVTALVPNFTVTKIPDVIYQMQYDSMMASLESEAAMYGMEAADYVPVMYGYEADVYADYIAIEYGAQVVIFQAIANQEGIEVSEEEMDEFELEYMEYLGLTDVEELYTSISRAAIQIYLMQEKVIDLLLETAVITEY
ncbi:MAG: FKBP-type peptidyl-prolyl cis-trans isomerase [Lachnospiraceae bacterium]